MAVQQLMSPHDLPWFTPAVLLFVVLSIIASGPLSSALSTRRWVGGALILSVGLIAAATLTPQSSALLEGAMGSATCNLARVVPAELSAYLVFGETLGNLLLFVPLGVTVALVPPGPNRFWLVTCAALLPFVIEVTQLLVPVLDRACEGADVIDNLLGLGIGLLLGWATGWTVRLILGSRTGSGRQKTL